MDETADKTTDEPEPQACRLPKGAATGVWVGRVAEWSQGQMTGRDGDRINRRIHE